MDLPWGVDGDVKCRDLGLMFEELFEVSPLCQTPAAISIQGTVSVRNETVLVSLLVQSVLQKEEAVCSTASVCFVECGRARRTRHQRNESEFSALCNLASA